MEPALREELEGRVEDGLALVLDVARRGLVGGLGHGTNVHSLTGYDRTVKPFLGFGPPT